MQKLLMVLTLSALSLAGCSGAGSEHDQAEPVTCPDGTVLSQGDVEALPGHHDAGFNATSACPELPSVTLTGLPAQLGAFQSAAFVWALDNGSLHHGHSMLSSLRWSPTPVADDALTSMTAYPSELVKREHQDVPVKFDGKLSFSAPGKVYLRAYAQIQGEGFDREEFWSPEVVINILAVEPTGVVVDVTHAAGGPLGELGPAEVPLALGDAVRFVNNDLQDHTLSWDSGPDNPGDLVGPMMGAGTPVVFKVPGTYVYNGDDLAMPRTVTIRVAAPA